MTVVVLGASGATGRHVVSTALDRGHEVVALVRRPGSFTLRAGLTETIWPDVTDAPALPATGVVISALGGSACADGIRSALTAMKAVGLTRLIAVSAHGVLESHDKSLYSRAVWAGVAERMRDKEAMEPLITGSGLSWTIVRPPKLSDHAATGKYRAGSALPIRVWSSIGRADLAAFLVDEAETPRYELAHPRITR